MGSVMPPPARGRCPAVCMRLIMWCVAKRLWCGKAHACMGGGGRRLWGSKAVLLIAWLLIARLSIARIGRIRAHPAATSPQPPSATRGGGSDGATQSHSPQVVGGLQAIHTARDRARSSRLVHVERQRRRNRTLAPAADHGHRSRRASPQKADDAGCVRYVWRGQPCRGPMRVAACMQPTQQPHMHLSHSIVTGCSKCRKAMAGCAKCNPIRFQKAITSN